MSEASKKIDARIKELADWRGDMLARIRKLIKQADARCGRGVEMARGTGVVPRRNDLHR